VWQAARGWKRGDFSAQLTHKKVTMIEVGENQLCMDQYLWLLPWSPWDRHHTDVNIEVNAQLCSEGMLSSLQSPPHCQNKDIDDNYRNVEEENLRTILEVILEPISN
jgi:hypothetical protein